MDTEKKNAGRPNADVKKRSPFKILAVAVLAVFVVLLLAILAVPTLLSSSGGNRFLLSKINRSVEGQVGMETFSVGWFSGVKLTNLTFDSDDGATQVKVGRIETQPRYTALLGKRVDLGKTVIDHPQVYLKVSPTPPSVPSTQPGAPKETPAPGVPFVLPVHLIDLELLAGDVTIELTEADASPQRVTFKNIASTVALNETGQTSRMALSMDVANGHEAGTVRAEGEVTPPKKGWTLEDTDGTFTVSIAKLELESLRPLLAMAGLDVQTGGVLNGDASVEIRKGNIETLSADATVENFSQGVGEQKMVFAEPVRLTAKGGFIDNALRIDAIDVKTPFCTATLSGEMEMLDYAVKADLAQTQDFLKQFTDLGGYGLAGAMDMTGRLDLAEEKIASAGKGTVKNLLLTKDGKTAPQTDVTLDYDMAMDNAQHVLTVAAATLTMAPGTVKVSNMTLPTGDAAGPITLAAQANLDIAKAWPYAQILADAPEDITLAGALASAVTVQTQGDIVQVKTNAATIRNLRVAKPDTEPFVQDLVTLTADVTLDTARQSIGVKTFDMLGARGETLIKITKGEIEQSSAEGVNTLDAEIEAEYDLHTVSMLAAPYLPDGLKVQGTRKDRFVLSSRWPENEPDKMMANLNGKGGFGFNRAEYYGLIFGPTELAIDIQQGIAAVVIPDANVNGGKLRFAGILNLTEEPMFLRLNEPSALLENVNINDVITAQLLTYVNPVFAGAVQTSGVANFTCRRLVLPLSGDHLDKIDIDGTVGIANIRLQAGEFLGQILALLNQRQAVAMTLRPTNILMQQGTVRYQDMQIDLSDYPLNFSGTLGLDKRLAMTVKLPLGTDFRPVRLADAGTARFEVPLGGTVDKPTIDVARLIERQGQQLIEDQLRRLFR